MLRASVRSSVLVVLLMFAPLPATAQTRPATQPSIDTLIRQLSAPNWKDRESAQAAIVRMGSPVRERLQQLARDRHADDETRGRAEAALRQIADDQETGGSIITLHLRDALPRDIYAEVSRQCGTELLPAEPNLWDAHPWQRQTVDLDQQPFWAAMKQLQAKTNIELAQWGETLRLVEHNGGDVQTRGPSQISGPFLIIANHVDRSQSIDLAAGDPETKTYPAAEKQFSVQLAVFAEPKLRVLQAPMAAHIEEAVDDKGNSLVPAEQNMDEAGSNAISGMWTASARLSHPPPNAGTKIA